MSLRRFLVLSFLVFSFSTPTIQAQDLGDELDAVDDFPDADTDVPDSPSSSGGAEDIPNDDLDDLGDLGDGGDAAPDADTTTDQADDLNLDDDLGEDLPAGENAQQPDEGDLPEDDLSLDEEEPNDENQLGDELGALDEKADEKAEKPTQAEATTTGTDLGEFARVKSINFRQLADRVRAVIGADKPIEFSRQVRSQRKQIIVEIRNAAISKSILKRAIDTGEFDGPVALIQAYESREGSVSSVKVLFQLRQMQEFKITRSGNDLYVDFALGGDGRLFRSGSALKQPTLPETFLTLDAKTRFTGKRISLNVKDADLQAVLKKITVETGQNFILTGAAQGKVSLNISNTPWDQVLAIILANLKLGYQKLGNVYRIAPVQELRTEITDAAKAIADSENLIPLETRLIPVNYARASEVSSNIKDFQTTRGKLSIDARTNSLVVTDTPDTLDKIATYIRSIDKQTALIQIEARIVEASQSFSRDLSQSFNIGAVQTGALRGSFLGISASDPITPVPALPATPDSGKGLRVSTSLGSIGAIDALLTYSESENMSKTIASPRVTVLDNKRATIENGIQINVTTTNASTGVSSTSTINQTLRLGVTPQVTSDGFVNLDISLARDTPGEISNGNTTTNTRNANTQLLVESGKTAVIGGIYTIDRTETEGGFPLLRALPIFGTLFRDTKTNTNSTTELLMFVSPKIINSNRAFLSYKDDIKEEDKEGEKKASADAAVDSGEDDIGDFEDL